MNNPNHKAHRGIKDLLKGELGEILLCDFFTKMMPQKHLKDRIRFRTIEEYPIPVPCGVNTKGYSYAATRFVDFVYVVVPGESAIYRQECFTIGFEIKTSPGDLEGVVEQLRSYEGYTDYFLLMVPDYLLPAGSRVVKRFPWVGIASFNTGKIDKLPCRQNVLEGRKIDMLYRLLFCDDHLEKAHVFTPYNLMNHGKEEI